MSNNTNSKHVTLKKNIVVNQDRINELFQNYLDMLDAVKAAEERAGSLLTQLVEEQGHSFQFNGELKQVRSRKGVPYVVTLAEEPREWLSRAREKRVAEQVAKGLTNGVHGDPAPEGTTENTVNAAPESFEELAEVVIG